MALSDSKFKVDFGNLCYICEKKLKKGEEDIYFIASIEVSIRP